MDLKRSLFRLESISPFIAKKIWELTLGHAFKIRELSDEKVEIEVPYLVQNRDSLGRLIPSIIVTASEYATDLLWRRHLHPELDVARLERVECEFLKDVFGPVKVQVILDEVEREKILSALRKSEEIKYETTTVVLDQREQTVATLHCVWAFRPLRPLALGGRNS